MASRARVLLTFLDITHPSSWRCFQRIESLVSSRSAENVRFRILPIANFKVQHFNRASFPETSKPVKLLLPTETPAYEDVDEDNEVFLALKQRPAVPTMIFLAVLEQEYPDFFIPAMRNIGEALWSEGRLVYRGCHLSRVAREIGISFRDSERIVSRLAHVNSRRYLSEFTLQAALTLSDKSPWFNEYTEERILATPSLEIAVNPNKHPRFSE